MMFSVITTSPEQTWRIGELLGAKLSAGDVVCLYGDLGAGKTSLSYGIALGLEVRTEYITSPTFAFVNEYEGRVPFYHIDLYRMRDPAELENIGFREYLESDGATVIEWAERAEHDLPQECLNVYLSPVNEHSREIGFYAQGARFEALLAELKKEIDRR